MSQSTSDTLKNLLDDMLNDAGAEIREESEAEFKAKQERIRQHEETASLVANVLAEQDIVAAVF